MPETPRSPGAESIGALLTQVRTARGMSQLRLAELLCAAAGVPTITRHEVSRWEREERIPAGHWLRWLAVVLDLGLDELELAASAARDRRAGGSAGPVDPLWTPQPIDGLAGALDRAPGGDLLRLAHAWLAGGLGPGGGLAPSGGLGGGPGLGGGLAPVGEPGLGGRLAPGGGLAPVTASPRRNRAGRPDPLAAVATRLGELRQMDDLVGGVELVGIVDRELRAAMALLAGHQASRAGRRVSRLVAEFAQLAGWVCADAGRPAAAGRAYRVALRLADEAGDRTLAAHVLGSLSHLVAGTGSPREALLLAQTGHAGARRTAPAGAQALLLHRVAHAAALARERRVSESALAAAARAADRRDPARDPPWLYWLDDAELDAMTGRCFAALRRPLRAEPLLRARLVGARAVAPRTAALDGGWLAQAYLDAGEPAQACVVAADALLAAIRASSARATRHALAAAPRLVRLSSLPEAREYADLLAAARPYLPVAGAATARWTGTG